MQLPLPTMPENVAAITVYVFDDDESVRRSLIRLLGAAGFRPVAFETAEALLIQLQSASMLVAACILLDITMPQPNGLELLRRMREMGLDTPVIALSSQDDKETRRLAHELGVVLFLCKPVDDRALLDAIRWVVDG